MPTSCTGIGSDAFLCCRRLLCYGCFIIMSQCCQLFSGTHKFIAVRTIGISCVSGLRAGCFPLIPYFSMCVITFASCNRNAYTFCLIVSLVSSCINCIRCHSHTICKHRVLISLLPAPSIRKRNIANLLCAVCRCHCSFRHVWSFRCLIDRNCYCSSYCIVVVCVIRCKYCLIAFVVYSRNDVRSCKAPCSCKFIAICTCHTSACHIRTGKCSIRIVFTLCNGWYCYNYRCCLGYCDGCFSGKFCVIRAVCRLEYPARLCGSGCRYRVRIAP